MPARILIVEDHEDNLTLVSYLLKEFGHDPVGMGGSETGLKAALGEVFDLILIDILMPGMDGFQLAARFRSERPQSKTPLVALTALAMVGDRDRILASGFDGYISKPIKPRSFVQEVDTFLPLEMRSQKALAADVALEPEPPTAIPCKAVVLVVDDVPENIGVIRASIEPFGYRVIGTTSIVGALAEARENRPDLVVTDIHLASQSGFDLLKELKSDDVTRAIPVMLMTSSVWTERDVAMAGAAGMEKVMERPVNPRRLLEEIEKALKAGDNG